MNKVPLYATIRIERNYLNYYNLKHGRKIFYFNISKLVLYDLSSFLLPKVKIYIHSLKNYVLTFCSNPINILTEDVL